MPRHQRLHAAIAAAVLTGCVSTPPPAPANDGAPSPDAAPAADAPPQADAAPLGPDADPICDSDGDGWPIADCATDPELIDCAPDDRAIFPGARETPGGADQDCLAGDIEAQDEAPRLTPANRASLIGWTNGQITLRFDPSQNYAPTELLGSAGNLLYGDTFDEKYSGVLDWSSWFSWNRNAGRLPMVTVEEGPAVVRLSIDWQVGGSGADPAMTGVSTYTLHPDGRIHRDEAFDVLEDSGGNDFLVAYIALAPDRFTRIENSGVNGGVSHDVGSSVTNIDIFYRPANDTPDYLCAYHNATGDRVAWLPQTVRRDDSGGIRATENTPPNSHQISLQFDWAYAVADGRGSYEGNFLIYAGLTDTGNPCAEVAPVDGAYRLPASLGPSAAVVTDSAGDDNSDGYSEGGGFYTVTAGGARVLDLTVNSAGRNVPPTSTVQILDMDLTHLAVIQSGGTTLIHGRDYLLQAKPDGGWLFLNMPLPAAGLRISTP